MRWVPLALALGAVCAAYEYKIVLADHTWTGEGQALRYIDHLKLLSEKLRDASGAVATSYRLVVNREWDLLFDALVTGTQGPQDVYGFALTRSQLSAENLEQLRDDPNGFKAPSAGFYAFVTQTQFMFTLRESVKAGGAAPAMKTCAKSASPLHVRVHGKDAQLKVFLSDAQSNTAPLSECGAVEFGRKPLGAFYLAFWARSHGSAWQLDVKNVLFESDAENTSIETYFSHFDHSLPRLFRKINLLSSQPEAPPARAVAAELNVTQIYQLEQGCYDKFDAINSLLASNLEQSEELSSYLQQQKHSVAEFSDSLMASLAKWIDNTAEQYAVMSRDADEIAGKLTAYNFQAAYRKTDALIAELEGLLSEKSETLKGLKSLATVYKQNISLIALAKKTLNKTPKLFRVLKYRLAHKREKGQSVALLSALSCVGVVVLGFLLSILRRLKRAQQKKLFE